MHSVSVLRFGSLALCVVLRISFCNLLFEAVLLHIVVEASSCAPQPPHRPSATLPRRMALTRPSGRASDPSSFANVECVRIRHVELDWTVDFERRIVRGTVVLHVASTTIGAPWWMPQAAEPRDRTCALTWERWNPAGGCAAGRACAAVVHDDSLEVVLDTHHLHIHEVVLGASLSGRKLEVRGRGGCRCRLPAPPG